MSARGWSGAWPRWLGHISGGRDGGNQSDNAGVQSTSERYGSLLATQVLLQVARCARGGMKRTSRALTQSHLQARIGGRNRRCPRLCQLMAGMKLIQPSSLIGKFEEEDRL